MVYINSPLISASVLRPPDTYTNCVAVEVHQATGSGDDMSFALEVEIDGAWPWNGWRLQPADRATGPSPGTGENTVPGTLEPGR